MKLRTQASATLKTKLSSTLKSWLPILQSSTLELEETLGEFAKENPYVEIKSAMATDFSSERKKIEIRQILLEHGWYVAKSNKSVIRTDKNKIALFCIEIQTFCL